MAHEFINCVSVMGSPQKPNRMGVRRISSCENMDSRRAWCAQNGPRSPCSIPHTLLCAALPSGCPWAFSFGKPILVGQMFLWVLWAAPANSLTPWWGWGCWNLQSAVSGSKHRRQPELATDTWMGRQGGETEPLACGPWLLPPGRWCQNYYYYYFFCHFRAVAYGGS